MENLRRRLMGGDDSLDPTGPRGPRNEPISVGSTVTSSSSDASSDEDRPQVSKPRKNMVVISSDEEDDSGSDSEVEVASTSKPLAPRRPDGNNQESRDPSPIIKPGFLNQKPMVVANQAVPDPLHRPVARPFNTQPTAIKPPSNPVNRYGPIPPGGRYGPAAVQYIPPSELPDVELAPGERENITGAEAEKALKELMGGSINDEEAAEITEEDTIVPGFRDNIRLMPHQVLGRRWMKEREDTSLKRYGGILADDMGLGKTIQTLTRVVEGRPKKQDREEGWSGSTLIVCPLALVEQWESEAKKMAPGIKVVKHHGSNRTSDPQTFRNVHIVVTTYDVVKSEAPTGGTAKDEGTAKSKKKAAASSDDDSDDIVARPVVSKGKRKAMPKNALFGIRWWRVVLDEAHNIKNHKTKGARACCALQAKFRWCLTGTPMQNNVTELYSLFDFLRIKPLNDLEHFNRTIAKPLKDGKGGTRAMKRLQVVLKATMLRRTKDQVINGKKLIELPPRTLNIISCPFSTQEQAFYEGLEKKMGDTVQKLMESNTGGGNAYISVLLLLLRLRQACDHPVLVEEDYKEDVDAIESKEAKNKDDATDPDDLAAAFGQLGVTRKCKLCQVELPRRKEGDKDDDDDDDLDRFCRDCAMLRAMRVDGLSTSAKLRKIMEILDEIEDRGEGEKTIVFSQFTSMLDLIEPFLKKRGVRFVRYDGKMRADMREHSLKQIRENESVKVILISFKAGSTGLNLTACNNVILVDMWWNPALEDQAFDRAHRFGQQRPVNIYKLKIDDTVEDRILALQEKKRELTKAALSGEKVKNLRLDMNELLALFRHSADYDDDEDEDED
ncbi:SNF2 family N-terminal domain-containing protein [Schizophyllum commune]